MNNKAHAPVVVGIDGGAEALAAARYAAWEAQRRGVGLRLVYAHLSSLTWGPTPLIDEYIWEQDWAQNVLRNATKEIEDTHPGLPIDTVAVQGRPAGALVGESAHASLVVLGTKSMPGVRGRLAGSVAAQVAAHAAAPVMIFRSDGARRADPSEFTGRPVVVGIDGSAESVRAFEFAAEEAVARQAELHALMVWDVLGIHEAAPLGPDDYDTKVEEAKAARLLAEATAGASERYPDLIVVRRTEHDLDVVRVLCDTALTAGLLVVGSRGHGGFLGLRLGSTVDALVREAPVPLAVVRGRNDQH
jgi:nucleotide-binding universal stress UspA family protein